MKKPRFTTDWCGSLVRVSLRHLGVASKICSMHNKVSQGAGPEMLQTQSKSAHLRWPRPPHRQRPGQHGVGTATTNVQLRFVFASISGPAR